jgi:hypothetical protein
MKLWMVYIHQGFLRENLKKPWLGLVLGINLN